MANYKTHTANPGEAADAQIEYAQKNIHTSLPARVISFDPITQTVSLEILIQKLMQDGTAEDYPPLLDVPVKYPRGGGFSATFPLKPGDEGTALFNERCIDAWWETGKPGIPLDYRMHDLSDAVFIPGGNSKPQVVKNFFTEGLSLQTDDGSTFIRIVNGKILIQGDIEHVGNTNQTGGQVVSDDVVASGISLNSHLHPGVKSGPDKTGGPV